MREWQKRLLLEAGSISQRIRGLAMISHGIVPNLVLSRRVLDKMAAAARKYIEDETGEAMVGLVLPRDERDPDGLPTIYVLDTISPDESAVRQLHTFQQGDDRQDEIIWWLEENWRFSRRKGRGPDGRPLADKWQQPLSYLGDWHKQPGYMIAPSGGDLMTALHWLDDEENNMDYLLVPILTLDHPATTIASQSPVNYVLIPQDDESSIRVDWWYIHRSVRMFQPIHPLIMHDEDLPALTPYPWHLVNETRFDMEYDRLSAGSLLLALVLWDTDGDLPLEICFMAIRPGLDRALLLVTNWNYPQSAPALYTAPLARVDPTENLHDVFNELWEQATLLEVPGWRWDPERTLLDYVHAAERHLGVRQDAAAPAGGPGPDGAPDETPEDES